MKQSDIDTYLILRYNEKGFYYYHVPTTVRRSGVYKVSVKKYKRLKEQYEKHIKNEN
jgi:hypothetical protein